MDMAEGMAGKGAAQVPAGEGFWKAMTDHRLCIRRYRVPSAKLKGRVRAVFLSDLHGSRYGDGQRDLLEQVCKAQPDVIFFGGDMADEHMPEVNTDLVMKALGQRYSCYYVSAIMNFAEDGFGRLKGGSGHMEYISWKEAVTALSSMEAGSISAVWTMLWQGSAYSGSSLRGWSLSARLKRLPCFWHTGRSWLHGT